MEGVNPKQAIGQAKPPHSTVPLCVLAEVGVGMFEGSSKYGRHNYRTSRILASVYYDATRRHIDSWFEGEDIDPDSGMSHITKAICSLVVLRDSMINDMLSDDRPPKVLPWHKEYLQQLTDGIRQRYPEPKSPFTEESHPAFKTRLAWLTAEDVAERVYSVEDAEILFGDSMPPFMASSPTVIWRKYGRVNVTQEDIDRVDAEIMAGGGFAAYALAESGREIDRPSQLEGGAPSGGIDLDMPRL